MGVQLNIKDAETVRLARQLADATGQPITKAIKAAIERELRENEKVKEERMRRLQEIVRGARKLWKPELLEVDIDDLLYDEYGLPK
ncbi:MAG: type II toxin-antitoxin system VapB family antitoxin [Pseudomonadota bacterium]